MVELKNLIRSFFETERTSLQIWVSHTNCYKRLMIKYSNEIFISSSTNHSFQHWSPYPVMCRIKRLIPVKKISSGITIFPKLTQWIVCVIFIPVVIGLKYTVASPQQRKPKKHWRRLKYWDKDSQESDRQNDYPKIVSLWMLLHEYCIRTIKILK